MPVVAGGIAAPTSLPPTLPQSFRNLLPATFEGGLEEQASLMNRMGEFVDAAVIITNQVAKMEDVSTAFRHLLVPLPG